MTNRVVFAVSVVACTLAGLACTVGQATPPLLSGPSDLAKSLTVTATPDVVSLGQSAGASGQSSKIAVQLNDETGDPISGREVRLEILVKGAVQDCGQLSQKTLFTESNGRAETFFTAPGEPLPLPNCANFAPGDSLTIVATPVGNNAVTAVQNTASIKMVSAGVILPPPDTPTPRIIFFPAGPTVGVDVTFDGTQSCPGAISSGVCVDNGGSIVSYQWNFGDGQVKSGPIVTHDFGLPQAYNVTLTVTNDRGRSAAVTQTVNVSLGDPTADFTFAPAAGSPPGHQMNFTGILSKAVGGATITTYAWEFGDGTTLVGPFPAVLHTYSSAGTFVVTLYVEDSLFRQSTRTSKIVTVP